MRNKKAKRSVHGNIVAHGEADTISTPVAQKSCWQDIALFIVHEERAIIYHSHLSFVAHIASFHGLFLLAYWRLFCPILFPPPVHPLHESAPFLPRPLQDSFPLLRLALVDFRAMEDGRLAYTPYQGDRSRPDSTYRAFCGYVSCYTEDPAGRSLSRNEGKAIAWSPDRCAGRDIRRRWGSRESAYSDCIPASVV